MSIDTYYASGKIIGVDSPLYGRFVKVGGDPTVRVIEHAIFASKYSQGGGFYDPILEREVSSVLEEEYKVTCCVWRALEGEPKGGQYDIYKYFCEWIAYQPPFECLDLSPYRLPFLPDYVCSDLDGCEVVLNSDCCISKMPQVEKITRK